MPRMNICDYVVHELNILRSDCNFTPDERLFFDLSAEGWDLAGIKTEMANLGHSWSESKISSLSTAVKRKIERVKKYSDVFQSKT